MMGELTIHKPSAVEVRRGLVKMPAVLGALEPLERTIFVASTAKTIAEYDGRELAGELAAALKWICRDVGYRVNDAEDMQYLVIRTAEILQRYYSTITLKDFRLAFEMCLTGELDEYLPKDRSGVPDRSHYQAFNAEYVCRILNAYKYRRAVILKKANDAMPPEPGTPITPEQAKELRNQIKHDCIEAFDYFKENGRLPEISPIAEMLYYNLLASVGLAPEIVVTADEQKAIFFRTINEFARSRRVGDMRRLEQVGPDAPELQHGAFTIARKKALTATFCQMVEQGLNITDYIKF